MASLDITTVSNEALVKKVIFMAIDYGTANPDYRATSENLKSMREQIDIGQNEILRRLNLTTKCHCECHGANSVSCYRCDANHRRVYE